jgi:hypothetical protein
MTTPPDDFVSLTRDSPWNAQVGCGVAIALLLGLVGGGLLYATHHYYGYWNWDRDGLVIIFGIVFGGVGVLMALASIHQVLAIRTPQTQAAISPGELGRAYTVQLRLRQPGPVRLRSLHARLVCEIRTRRQSETQRGKSYYATAFPHQDRIFTCDTAQDVAAGALFEQTSSFQVPFDSPPTSEIENQRVTWRIEVWGRVRWWPGFMHPFTVQVK